VSSLASDPGWALGLASTEVVLLLLLAVLLLLLAVLLLLLLAALLLLLLLVLVMVMVMVWWTMRYGVVPARQTRGIKCWPSPLALMWAWWTLVQHTAMRAHMGAWRPWAWRTTVCTAVPVLRMRVEAPWTLGALRQGRPFFLCGAVAPSMRGAMTWAAAPHLALPRSPYCWAGPWRPPVWSLDAQPVCHDVSCEWQLCACVM
jgi:hypothetical protein